MSLARLSFVITMLISTWFTPTLATAEATTCTKTIEHYRIAETGAGGHSLENAAIYCLAQDVFVKWNYSWIEGRYQQSSKSVIEINESNITLDLKKHEIWDDGYTTAAITSGSPSNERKATHVNRDISIKNGVINVKKSGDGILIIGLGGDQNADVASDIYEISNFRSDKSRTEGVDPYFVRLAERSIQNQLTRNNPHSPKDYLGRNITIENLKINIKGNGRGIVVQGAGTIIKNNVIEVESGTAIWLGGPNAIIEGNTIIVSGRKNVFTADAAIRLKHADGATIRNNQFIIRNGANKRLVSTFDTGFIRFENNRINGLAKGDPVAKAFSGELNMQTDTGSRTAHPQ